MTGVSALLALLAACLSLLIASNHLVAAIASIAAAIGTSGVWFRSRGAIRVSAWLALLNLSVSLWTAQSPATFIVPSLLGIAVMLLIVISDFDARFHEAELAPGVMHGQVRHWLQLASVSAASILTVVGGGILLAGVLATPLREITAGIAILMAFIVIQRGWIVRAM
jgi:hypothetical protein